MQVRFVIGLILAISLVACSEELETTVSPESVPLPTVPTVNSEIGFEATIGGQAVSWKNFTPGSGNGVDSAVYFQCVP